MRRHLLLIGLPGSGKSTVGALAASRLAAAFEDADRAVTARAGRPIAEIFATDGETAFRDMERAAVAAALRQPARVIAAGGGWAAAPGNLEAARPRALIIYLVCSAETAAARAADVDQRPLLRGEPLTAMRELLDGRRRFYERAEVRVETDHRGLSEVADEVVALARSHGGW